MMGTFLYRVYPEIQKDALMAVVNLAMLNNFTNPLKIVRNPLKIFAARKIVMRG